MSKSRERRKKPDRSTTICAEQLGFEHRNRRRLPRARRAFPPSCVLDLDTKPSEAINHHPRVFTVEPPVSVETPSASAAQTSARFVILFDPGGRTRP